MVNPAALAVTGITALSPQLLNAARQWGLKIRLLARAQRRDQRLLAEVAPVAIGPQSVFYGLDGVDNAVALTSERLGQTVYQGPGAGGLATANSILSDLYRLTSARGTSFTPAPAPSGLVAGQCNIWLTTALIKGGKRVDNGQLVGL